MRAPPQRGALSFLWDVNFRGSSVGSGMHDDPHPAPELLRLRFMTRPAAVVVARRRGEWNRRVSRIGLHDDLRRRKRRNRAGYMLVPGMREHINGEQSREGEEQQSSFHLPVETTPRPVLLSARRD